MIYTFWEGPMPDYIQMCLETWKMPHTVLNYSNLQEYTTINMEGLKSFTLPQQSDAVRAHVLRDNGGWWLDSDTILLTEELPKENVIGDLVTRAHSTGLCHWTKDAEQFFKDWAEYQDRVIADPDHSRSWRVLVNMFTDEYVQGHKEITIYPYEKCRPELWKVSHGDSQKRYEDFYFWQSCRLADMGETSIFVLHNSWTPAWYKALKRSDILEHGCTMSNILRDALRR